MQRKLLRVWNSSDDLRLDLGYRLGPEVVVRRGEMSPVDLSKVARMVFLDPDGQEVKFPLTLVGEVVGD